MDTPDTPAKNTATDASTDLPARVGVQADPDHDPALRATAARLAAELSLPLHDGAARDTRDLLLVVTSEQLELRVVNAAHRLFGGRPIAVNLARIDTHTGPGRSLRQPLLRAVGLRKGDPARPSVLDATAGFGEDAWLLAAMGCRVTAVEREPIAAALLADGARRAGSGDAATLSRLNIVVGNAVELLRGMAGRVTAEAAAGLPQVIYLDPMFPAQRKAEARKPMRVLRWLVGSDDVGESRALLDAALAVASQRVVVKRPLKAEPLAGRPPAATHRGNAVRYDVYPTR